MKRTTKREGFTLVELLIVIVVIGILSAMMMLSSTEAVSSARANNIIANLRNLKTAALAWYVDSLDVVEASGFNLTNATHFPYVKHYLNNDKASDLAGYSIVKDNTSKKWFIQFAGASMDANVKTKLMGRAASVGLLSGTADNATKYAGGNGNVYMLVR